MANDKVINDATRSSQGTIYQIYVALEKCFEMDQGQSVIVERMGDVTVPGQSQTEIKMFAERAPLTDSHPNFWNTLKNWMDEKSNVEQFRALILHTTQPFGAKSKFKDWNQSDLEKRLSILTEIHAASEQRYQPNAGEPVPDSLKLQRTVMEASKRAKLKSVAERIAIADESDDLGKTYNRLVNRYCGHIPEANRESYLSTLLGLVIRPTTIEKAWTIAKAEFDATMQKVATAFLQGTKRFPTKHRCSNHDKLTAEHEALKGHPFVAKIVEINHHEQIPQALRDYLFTQKTMLSDFYSYSAEEREYKMFAEDVESSFVLAYQLARQKVTAQMEDSQRFFNQTILEQSPPFSGRETPPRDFKNGVIHMHLNDESKPHKWKLEH